MRIRIVLFVWIEYIVKNNNILRNDKKYYGIIYNFEKMQSGMQA
jgi:hypothetical protein